MVDIAWAAGLFEGEGCISIKKDYKGVGLQMVGTDRDVLERMCNLFGGSIYTMSMAKRPAHHKQQYSWTLQKRDKVMSALEKMLPFFGQRRACKALDAFDHIEL